MKAAIISQASRQAMIDARTRGVDYHRQVTRQAFSEAKRHFGIPTKHKLRCELDDMNHPQYLQIIRKKTGTGYQVADGLVPVYTVDPVVETPVVATTPYVKVRNTEALALLQSFAVTFGKVCKPKSFNPTWAGTAVVKGALIVPLQDKHYTLPLEDAIAALAIYGELVELPKGPEGFGGALADTEHLYLPA